MAKRIGISRRAMLRAAGGAAITLPALEIMLDRHGTSFAQSTPIPKRYVVCFGGQSLGGDDDPLHNDYVPNTVGANYDLEVGAGAARGGEGRRQRRVRDLPIPTANGGTVPAAGRRDDFHVSSLSPLLSGVRSPSDTTSAGPTSDQLVAAAIAGNTPFKSLVYRVQVGWYLSVSAPYGRDMISYKANPAGGKPLAIQPMVSPKMAFDSLFTNFTPPNDAAAGREAGLHAAQPQERARSRRRQSAEADDESAGSARADQQRLSRHFDEIRDLERADLGDPARRRRRPARSSPIRAPTRRWAAIRASTPAATTPTPPTSATAARRSARRCSATWCTWRWRAT